MPLPLRLLPLSLSLSLLTPPPAHPGALLTPAPAHAGAGVFAEDAAWCWFSDPRAVVHEGRIYAGWVTADGSVQVGARPLDGTATSIATLAPQFEVDDHDNPGLAFLPDGRLAAFYSRHSKGDMFLRTTTRPGDLADWTPQRALGFLDPSRGPRGVTYASPFVLGAESDRLWLFWRGSDFKPTFSHSLNGGEGWTPPRTLIHEAGRGTDNRPYVKYWSDSRGRIDFIFTDGHPRNETTNSVYYARYENGRFHTADGTVIATLDELPLSPSACDRIYHGATAGRAWIWSIATDAAGHPVVGYTRLPSEQDHRYHYARWDGKAWIDHEITPAGSWFPKTEPGKTEREQHYSGGLALDPADPSIVYLSRPVNGVFEIERWTTPDGGRTWKSEPITSNSPADNVRPYVPPGVPARRRVVLWMHNSGGYIHYTRYRTQLHYRVQ